MAGDSTSCPSDLLPSPKAGAKKSNAAPKPGTGILMPMFPSALMGKGEYSSMAPNSLPANFREAKAQEDESSPVATEAVKFDFPRSADIGVPKRPNSVGAAGKAPNARLSRVRGTAVDESSAAQTPPTGSSTTSAAAHAAAAAATSRTAAVARAADAVPAMDESSYAADDTANVGASAAAYAERAVDDSSAAAMASSAADDTANECSFVSRFYSSVKVKERAEMIEKAGTTDVSSPELSSPEPSPTDFHRRAHEQLMKMQPQGGGGGFGSAIYQVPESIDSGADDKKKKDNSEGCKLVSSGSVGSEGFRSAMGPNSIESSRNSGSKGLGRGGNNRLHRELSFGDSVSLSIKCASPHSPFYFAAFFSPSILGSAVYRNTAILLSTLNIVSPGRPNFYVQVLQC